MEIVILKNSADAAVAASTLIARLIAAHPGHNVLGLATGSTPLKTYEELVKLYKTKQISFRKTTTFNLDEYVGLTKENPNSYHAYMHKNLFSLVDLDPSRCHIPDGTNENLELECQEYEEKIGSAGSIDLQLLGLGQDGHIGFNEPSSSLSSRTRLKTLTAQTREANAVHFKSADEVPKHVITMGLGTIMESKHCLLLAFGKSKAQAVRQMVEGPITASVPASILQMHSHCTVILDEEAAALLERKEYYREVFANKPPHQRWDLPLN